MGNQPSQQAPLFVRYLFDDDANGARINSTHFAIRVKNIWFLSIDIVSVKKGAPNLIVHITNSTVSELMYRNTVSIIDSLPIRTKLFIENSLLHNIIKGACLRSAQTEFQIVNSKVLHDGQQYVGPECPQLIVTGDFGLIFAKFIRSKFKRIFLIDLKPTEETKSNVSMINSVFDDEGISDCC